MSTKHVKTEIFLPGKRSPNSTYKKARKDVNDQMNNSNRRPGTSARTRGILYMSVPERIFFGLSLGLIGACELVIS